MPITVAMYERSYDHIGARLEALGLEIDLILIGRDGALRRNGAPIDAASTSIDYVWLSSHLNADGMQEQIFGLCEKMGRVGVLQTYNAGLDHPFYKRMASKGTRLCNSSAQGIAIAEYVMAQVLAVNHPIDRQRELQAAREWKITRFREISETSWLIYGFGPIGREIAKRVKAFGADVTVIRRQQDTGGIADRVAGMSESLALLPNADIVVLACPLNAETRGFAGTQFFAALKPGTILVNIARGALIDDAALQAALGGDRLQHAVLDVFSEEPLPSTHPFWSHRKVRMTAHTSFGGSGVQKRWDALFLDNIARFARGDALVNVVDPSSLA